MKRQDGEATMNISTIAPGDSAGKRWQATARHIRAPDGNTGNGNGQAPDGAVLVCGGGVAGIQASLDLSAAGFAVYLVEESPTIGGTMARLDKTFPTGDCATCIISPKLVQCMRDYNIEVLTMADVAIAGRRGRGLQSRDPTPSPRRHRRKMHRLRRLLVASARCATFPSRLAAVAPGEPSHRRKTRPGSMRSWPAIATTGPR